MKCLKWALLPENLTLSHAYSKAAEPPAHPHSLISTQSGQRFFVCYLESKLAKSDAHKVPKMKLISVT